MPDTQRFSAPTIGSFFGMLGSDTRAMGRVLDVLHCNIKGDRGGVNIRYSCDYSKST